MKVSIDVPFQTGVRKIWTVAAVQGCLVMLEPYKVPGAKPGDRGHTCFRLINRLRSQTEAQNLGTTNPGVLADSGDVGRTSKHRSTIL